MNRACELLAVLVASWTTDVVALTRGLLPWTVVAIGLCVLGIVGRWWAQRRALNQMSRSENEAMRRYVNRNYD